MPKIIIPRDGGAGRMALASNYDPLAIAIKMIMKMQKKGLDCRLSFEDPLNLIIYTGEHV